MTESNTAETWQEDAARARQLLLRAATHNFGSSLRNDLVAEAAVWAALYQAGVIERTADQNGDTASALSGKVEELSNTIRDLGDTMSRRSGPAR